jgi:hypothetical protein
MRIFEQEQEAIVESGAAGLSATKKSESKVSTRFW